MFISLNRLKELIDFDYTPKELDRILTMLGIEVEAVHDYAAKYDKFVIAEVLEKEPHPSSDHLSLCTLNYGAADTIKVVCGAPNVAAGQKIVYATLGAWIPGAGFKIEKKKIRGIESKGMICSQKELDLGEDASGIWVLPAEAVPGTPLAEYLKLNDVVFDISITPNRPDCLSHFGIAREIAAYKREKFVKPEIKIEKSGKNAADQINVQIDDPELCPKYYGLVLNNIKVTPSPEWLRQKITLLGLRSINTVVDATNWVMYETGQPLHAFDLNMIPSGKIVVKTASAGEKFTTLDDKERTLDEKMLMITDNGKSVAIAGVMGGQNSEIKDTTTDVFIESAYFNPSSVRRTSKKLGLQTDASYRFERGADPQILRYAAEYAAEIINKYCGGTIAQGESNNVAKEIPAIKIPLRFQRTRDIIGKDIPNEEIIAMLESLEFEISDRTADSVLVTVPSYRADISLEVDLIEEVAIMSNYDDIPVSTHTDISFGSGIAQTGLAVPEINAEIRRFYVESGFVETLTQNIIDPASANIFTDKLIKIANPLGEEMSVMRPSMIPSMLKTIAFNARFGTTDLKLFEIGKEFNVPAEGMQTFVPGVKETSILTIAITGNAEPFNWKDKQRAIDFYDIKGIYEDFEEHFNLSGLKCEQNDFLSCAFTENAMSILRRGENIGKFGEISKQILKKFGITAPVFIFTFNLEALAKVKRRDTHYSPVSPFPSVTRDLGFIVPQTVASEVLISTIKKFGGKYLKNVEVFDVYEGLKIGAGNKNIAFSLEYSSLERTLTDAEVNESINAIVSAVEKQCGGKLREF